MWKPIKSAPKTGATVICGWFAGEPHKWPLEHKETLRWRRGAWRRGRDSAEWTPTHWLCVAEQVFLLRKRAKVSTPRAQAQEG